MPYYTDEVDTHTHTHTVTLRHFWQFGSGLFQYCRQDLDRCPVALWQHVFSSSRIPLSTAFQMQWPLAHCSAFCCVKLAVCCSTLSLFIACDRCGFNLSVYNKKRQKAPLFFIQSAPSIPCPPPQPSALSSLLIQCGPALLTRL